MKKRTFKNFKLFWDNTQDLDSFQRKIIFLALPKEEQAQLVSDFKTHNWLLVVVRHMLEAAILKTKLGVNMDFRKIKKKVLSGKSVCVSSVLWDFFISTINNVTTDLRHIKYILEDIKVLRLADVVYICLDDGSSN